MGRAGAPTHAVTIYSDTARPAMRRAGIAAVDDLCLGGHHLPASEKIADFPI